MAANRSLHRGTEIALVSLIVLGGGFLSMVPIGLLMAFVGPVDVPLWRDAAALGVAAILGTSFLGLARGLRGGSSWTRPVAIVALVACVGAMVAMAIEASDEGGDGAGYLWMAAFTMGGMCLMGAVGLLTRGATLDFRKPARHESHFPDPPPPLG